MVENSISESAFRSIDPSANPLNASDITSKVNLQFISLKNGARKSRFQSLHNLVSLSSSMCQRCHAHLSSRGNPLANCIHDTHPLEDLCTDHGWFITSAQQLHTSTDHRRLHLLIPWLYFRCAKRDIICSRHGQITDIFFYVNLSDHIKLFLRQPDKKKTNIFECFIYLYFPFYFFLMLSFFFLFF